MGLKLKIVPLSTKYNGVLDFDFGHYVFCPSAGFSSDMTNNKKFTFKLWLDSDEGYNTLAPFIHTVDDAGGNNIFDICTDGSMFRICGYWGGSYNYYYPMENYDNQVLECEVNKIQGDVSSFIINNVEQTAAKTDSASVGNFTAGWYFGISGTPARLIGNATIWDIKLYDTDGAETLIHHWEGYPNGNTDAAWDDIVGGGDGVFNGEMDGSAGPATRNVVGTGDSSGSVLQIVPSVETYTGVADFNNNAVTIIATSNGGNDDFRRGSIFKWKMWLDNSSGYTNDLFVLDTSTASAGQLIGWLFDSSLYLSIIGIAYNMYDISGLDSQILDCELNGGFGSYPNELKINNVVQSGTNTVPSDYSDHSGVYFGEAITTVFGVTLDDLDNATLWDIQAETSLGVPTHAWAGYPAGDTSAAWVDTVGDLDSVLVGPLATRDIEGVDPGESNAGSKLIIDPSILN